MNSVESLEMHTMIILTQEEWILLNHWRCKTWLYEHKKNEFCWIIGDTHHDHNNTRIMDSVESLAMHTMIILTQEELSLLHHWRCKTWLYEHKKNEFCWIIGDAHHDHTNTRRIESVASLEMQNMIILTQEEWILLNHWRCKPWSY